MAKLRNHAAIPYLVEIHNDYWRGIFKEEHITNQEEQKKRKLAEKEKIRSFISGIENAHSIDIDELMARVNLIVQGTANFKRGLSAEALSSFLKGFTIGPDGAFYINELGVHPLYLQVRKNQERFR